MKFRPLAIAALALVVALSSGALWAAPGKGCNGLVPGSHAFKQCIQAQVHGGHTDNGKGPHEYR